MTRAYGLVWDVGRLGIGGAGGDRTPDLRIANAALSQLSYGPDEDTGSGSARGSRAGVDPETPGWDPADARF